MSKGFLSFRKLQSDIRKINVRHIEIGASNAMNFWDQTFAYTLLGIEMQLVFISLKNRNKKIRRAANRALHKLEILKRSFNRVRAPLSENAKSIWVERLQKCFV